MGPQAPPCPVEVWPQALLRGPAPPIWSDWQPLPDSTMASRGSAMPPTGHAGGRPQPIQRSLQVPVALAWNSVQVRSGSRTLFSNMTTAPLGPRPGGRAWSIPPMAAHGTYWPIITERSFLTMNSRVSISPLPRVPIAITTPISESVSFPSSPRSPSILACPIRPLMPTRPITVPVHRGVVHMDPPALGDLTM